MKRFQLPVACVRLKAVESDQFEWVSRAFGSLKALKGGSAKVLRALLARSHELVRCDIPKKTQEVYYRTLERAVDNADSFAKVLERTTISDSSVISAQYPYTLKDLGIKLGGRGWHIAQELITRTAREKGINIKQSDNKYHYATKYGKPMTHKYSDGAADLLKKGLGRGRIRYITSCASERDVYLSRLRAKIAPSAI